MDTGADAAHPFRIHAKSRSDVEKLAVVDETLHGYRRKLRVIGCRGAHFVHVIAHRIANLTVTSCGKSGKPHEQIDAVRQGAVLVVLAHHGNRFGSCGVSGGAAHSA